MVQKHLSMLEMSMIRDRTVLNMRVDSLLRSMVYELRSFVVGNTKEETSTTITPRTWWEMLKRDHFPQWLLERFPVRYDVHEHVKAIYHICPHLEAGPRQDHVQFISYEPTTKEDSGTVHGGSQEKR